MLCTLWTRPVMPHVMRSVLRCHCGSSDKSVTTVVEVFHSDQEWCSGLYGKKFNFFYKVNGVCLVFEFFKSSQLSFWIFNVFYYNWNFIITNVILSPPQICYTEISVFVKCSYKKWRQIIQKYCQVNARKTDYITNIHKFIYK